MMKLTASCAGLAAGAIVLGMSVAGTHAASYYWDTNGAAAGIGSATSPANWLSNSWATSATGTAATGPWPNAQPFNTDEAVFSGTAGTLNISADVYANALRFLANGYTIASTGGALHLAGANPLVTVNLPGSNNTATISAPIVGDVGFTVAGNGLSGGLKFLVLANTSATSPNAFSGTLTIDAGGGLRIGGGPSREQIPDAVDLAVSGVVDFITSGGASDMKQERVRNVTVSGTSAIFSVGNGADFIVNSLAGAGNENISVNGNTASVPGKLSISGWAGGAGAGDLTLNASRVKINATSGTSAIGGRVVLSGNLYASGDSRVINNNGNAASASTNTFTHKAFDFAAAAHTIDVADGTLTFTSASALHPLEVTSLSPGGSLLTKTGAGTWLWEHAVQTDFAGSLRVEDGVLRLGGSERLADHAGLQIAGGGVDLQSFSETVRSVLLEAGTIDGASAATLTSTTDFQVKAGTAHVKLAGAAGLEKSTAATAVLAGDNAYGGATTIREGTLLVNGTHSGGAGYSIAAAGTLGGVGIVNSPITVEGKLAPGQGVGTLTIGGDVTLHTGAKLAIELGSGSADKLIATNLQLNAGSFLEVVALTPQAEDSWCIAEYSGLLAGVFDHVTDGYRVDYSIPNQLVLRVAQPGDFDGNGRVDSADYVVWRKGLGSKYQAGDYDAWRANFGVGAAAGGGAILAAPEPAGVFVELILAIILQLRATRRTFNFRRAKLSCSLE